VNCRKGDPTYGNVLQLISHGDKFEGKGPIGVSHNGDPIDANTGLGKWNWNGYQHKCAPFCNVQRVGASVRSKVAITSGVTEVVMKPCAHFGSASTVFLFSYQQEACGDPDKPNVVNQCSKGYTANCCIAGNCTINPNGKTGDVCRGVWVMNKEIDIEIPSSIVAGDAANDPANIDFGNMRANSVTAFPWSYKHHTKCAIHDRTNADGTSACEDDHYVRISPAMLQNDGHFHAYKIDWDGKTTVKVFVDDILQQTITDFVPSVDLAAGELPLQLNLASWFPNAWAGSPDFETCVTEIASVKITGSAGPTPPPPTPSAMRVVIHNGAGIDLKVRNKSDQSIICELEADAACTAKDDFIVISKDGTKSGDPFDSWWGDASWKTADVSISVTQDPNAPSYLNYEKLKWQ